MSLRDAPATFAILIATTVVSAVLLLFVNPQIAAFVGGFAPGRLQGHVIAGLSFSFPVWLTPLTATLVHGGWLHLFFNMLMLGYTGRFAERALGAVNIVLLYVIGAFAAAAGQWVEAPGSVVPMIGASGAISAIVAAYAILYGSRRAKAIGPIPAWLVHAVWLGVAWTLINAALSFALIGGSPIAVGAHIGGFIAGLILTRPLYLWRYRNA